MVMANSLAGFLREGRIISGNPPLLWVLDAGERKTGEGCCFYTLNVGILEASGYHF